MTRSALNSMHMSWWPAGDYRRSPGFHPWHHPVTHHSFIFESRDLLEDICERLILRPPVQEVIPVVTTGYFLFAVNNTEKKYLY